jgi:sucrose-6-phosphate hydrolase SacC (GH32 family)
VLPDNTPFNQQMSIPAELTLKSTSRGPRLCRTPVKEVEALRIGDGSRMPEFFLTDKPIAIKGADNGMADLETEFYLDTAKSVTLRINGMDIVICAEGNDASLSAFGRRVSLPADGPINLRVLVDKTSVEIFAQNGEVTLSGYHLAGQKDFGASLCAGGGKAKVFAMKSWPLKSALPAK